ncbi:MAG: thioredoxin domain-containing protein [Candidatus Margulisbacteria bacterium]|nr:thioredoxin domain-containing protein [Candidatus Margulisiibacteriota bacterium]
MNALQFETSPYLLQHQDNPVEWMAWGEAAFNRAKSENKLIFLSIGYSTCHWCHVMAHESFEDTDVAAFLNAHFVSIKVDREERPDVDHAYMSVCQLTTGSGGWPLTVFLTPDLIPFYVGTYFPKETAHGRIGLMTLLARISEHWQTDPEAIRESGVAIQDALRDQQRAKSGAMPGREVLVHAYSDFLNSFDETFGGFGGAPKFPCPHQLLFLMRYARVFNEPKALEMVTMTLEKIRLGGIYDQVGLGVHRYSTDVQWRMPHFEKMLYDQALMMMAFSECEGILFKQTVDEIAMYVRRELLSPEGFFYAAEDADTEGEEGAFYLWQDDVIRFESVDDLTAWMPQREALFLERERREKPSKDTKILTDWNGLMIAAFATAGFVEEARKACDALLETRVHQNGLWHCLGRVPIVGMASDYAYFSWGLLELFLACDDDVYLRHAVSTMDEMIRVLWDDERGVFRLSSDPLFLDQIDVYDGACPSANSVAVYVLIQLVTLTQKRHYRDYAERLLKFVSRSLSSYAAGHAFWLVGLLGFLPLNCGEEGCEL